MHILPYTPVKREPLRIVNHDSNPGVRPLRPQTEETDIIPNQRVHRADEKDGEMHILPYPFLPGDDASIAAKRGPLVSTADILPHPHSSPGRNP